MLSLFLGVMTYMEYDSRTKIQSEIASLKGQQDKDKGTIQTLDQDRRTLKDAIGYNFDAIGSAQEANTVIHALTLDFNNVAGSLPGAPQSRTVRELLAALRIALNTQQQVATQSNTSATTAQANFNQQIQRQETAVTQAKDDQTKSEVDLRGQQTEHQKAVAKAQSETTLWQQQYRTVQSELEQLKDHLAQVEVDNEKLRAKHLDTIRVQKDSIRQLENLTFDAPDGKVELVDNTTKSVWIDRGTLDFLRPAITFSVLVADNTGVGKSTRDVKAYLEVVEVTGPHRSRCRILQDDIARPITPGDPIFSPVYQAGRVQRFAFVGIIDLDGDGKSDRALLEELMTVNGGLIVLQVDDQGVRQPADAMLDVTTKFVVQGEIPDPTQFPGLDEKAREATEIGDQFSALKKEAADSGVQIIKLDDFLIYMGIRTQRRVYRPGEDAGWTLRSGAQSASVDETVTDRTSAGQTSGLFRNNRLGARPGAAPSGGRNTP